jgi:subtilisin family serine protease
MKRSLALFSLIAVAACSDQVTTPEAPLAPPAEASATRGYIVVLKDGDEMTPSFARAAVGEITEKTQIEPKFVYTTVLNGFAAELTETQAAALREDPRVKYVEEDAEGGIMTTQTVNLFSWGLDRIDQRALPVSASYTYTSSGVGVNAYILDSGINLAHLDFGTRANYIPNGRNGDFVNDGRGSASDCNGHGTHVAGTVGGVFSGVAKGATIWAGRVVNCSGGGTSSMVIAGMDWIAANGQKPGVVNMSLGYGNVTAVRDAATRLVAAGFTVAAAAGNGNFSGRPISACSESPANSPNVLTVGATASNDTEASFSNYGTCVDLLAPGVSIYSADYTVTNQVTTKSGTSMASPHVAGVAALYLQLNPTATPAQVSTAILANTTNGVVSLHRDSRRNGTPNKLLFTNY